jgi:imidazolonepropionase-like amidohydrolase
VALALGPFAAQGAAQTVAITGGKVFPVSGPPIERGTVLMRDGKVVAVGASVQVPSDAERVDATGKWVTPGLVNSVTQVGLVEIEFGGPPRETSANGADSIAAAFTAWTGINPRSVIIPPTRDDGVTTVGVLPVGGLIAGQAAFLDLVDGSTHDMLIRAPAAMVGEIGDANQAGTSARGQLLVKLRTLLEDTKAYERRRSDFERAQTRPFIVNRLDLEATIPVVEGRLPMILYADRASDIESALDLAREYKLKLVIAGGAEAWMVADKLASARVPVMVGAMNNIPSSFASLGTRQENAGLLRKAGVSVILIGNAGGGDEEAFNARNIRYEAGNAVAYGMSWDDALRAITLTPAEVFGFADRVGSLRAGAEANVVVWSGDPFEFSTRAAQVFVRGRKVTDESRQDMLIQRYKTLPPSYSAP